MPKYGAVKEPWRMTREEVMGIVTLGGYFKDVENEVWRFTGKKREAGLTYLREAINTKTRRKIHATMRNVLDDHKVSVEEALSKGKPVPLKVLKDYPKLTRGKRKRK